jgi:hypothetical protein
MMVLESNNNLNEKNEEVINPTSTDLVDMLKGFESQEAVSAKINSDQKVLVKAYNAKETISDETVISFIK